MEVNRYTRLMSYKAVSYSENIIPSHLGIKSRTSCLMCQSLNFKQFQHKIVIFMRITLFYFNIEKYL